MKYIECHMFDHNTKKPELEDPCCEPFAHSLTEHRINTWFKNGFILGHDLMNMPEFDRVIFCPFCSKKIEGEYIDRYLDEDGEILRDKVTPFDVDSIPWINGDGKGSPRIKKEYGGTG